MPAVIEEIRGPGSVGDVALPIGYHWLKTNRRIDPDLLAASYGTGRLDGADRTFTVSGIEFEAFELGHTADSDLTLEVHPHDDGLDLVLMYRADRLEPAFASRMGRHLRNLLDAGVNHPEVAIGRLPMLTPAEEAEPAGSSSLGEEPSGTLVGLIDARLAGHPDDVVIRGQRPLIDCRRARRAAGRLAAMLRHEGVRAGDRVWSSISSQAVDVPVVLVGILRLGAAYVGT